MSEKEKTEQKPRPTCPRCDELMSWVRYVGYYDEFSYWICGCDEDTPPDEGRDGVWRGSYA